MSAAVATSWPVLLPESGPAAKGEEVLEPGTQAALGAPSLASLLFSTHPPPRKTPPRPVVPISATLLAQAQRSPLKAQHSWGGGSEGETLPCLPSSSWVCCLSSASAF